MQLLCMSPKSIHFTPASSWIDLMDRHILIWIWVTTAWWTVGHCEYSGLGVPPVKDRYIDVDFGTHTKESRIMGSIPCVYFGSSEMEVDTFEKLLRWVQRLWCVQSKSSHCLSNSFLFRRLSFTWNKIQNMTNYKLKIFEYFLTGFVGGYHIIMLNFVGCCIWEISSSSPTNSFEIYLCRMQLVELGWIGFAGNKMLAEERWTNGIPHSRGLMVWERLARLLSVNNRTNVVEVEAKMAEKWSATGKAKLPGSASRYRSRWEEKAGKPEEVGKVEDLRSGKGSGEGKGVGRLTGGGGRRRMVTLMAVERKWGGVDNLTSEWEEGAG